MYKIVLFGGTAEGREIADALSARKIPSLVCVATEYGEQVLHCEPPVEISIGKLGDERALKDLMAAAQDPDLSYIDYLEIRNSIERLGGTAPERTFDGDPSFEALHGMDQ